MIKNKITSGSINRRYYLKYVELANGESKLEVEQYVKKIINKIKDFKKEEYDLNITLSNLNIFKIYKKINKKYREKINICIFSIDIKCDNWVFSDEDNDFDDEEQFTMYLFNECNCYDLDDEEYVDYDNLD